jgi:hypothetical protein
MSTLNEYLGEKRQAVAARKSCIAAGEGVPMTLTARVRAEGRSGNRRIRIRDFQVISDSATDFAGYDLVPSSPELQLGVLGSCLTHTFQIQAATLGVPLYSLSWRSPASSIRAPVLPDSRMFRSIRTRFAMSFSSPPPLRRPRSVCCGRRWSATARS